ncbi:hypothetical protein [Actinoplanes sp. ATCC 53533]|uniref:hypothetical protein n=1 Tax=Actinoplanes sp. ATCC 53533 TaxID=1288362 RepID=UPI000F778BC8|nr:hypothetical protein [Actinoplanes sp. ATCC 53533]
MTTVDIPRTSIDPPSSHGVQDTNDPQRASMAEQDIIIAGLSTAARNMQRELDAANERHEQSVSQHRADIAAIGERLLEEAQERRWCSAYDTVVDQLNNQLTVELPVRELDYEVEVNVRVTVRVAARGEDDAEDRAGEIIRMIEQDIDERPTCTAYPQDSDAWDIRLL